MVMRASISGGVQVQPGNFCAPGDGGSVQSTLLSLQTSNGSPAQVAGQASYTIASPGSFESLGIAANMRVRVLHLRVKSGGPVSVRTTHATAGAVTHPSTYQLLIEVAEAEQLTAVAVQGEAVIEWIAFGPAAA